MSNLCVDPSNMGKEEPASGHAPYSTEGAKRQRAEAIENVKKMFEGARASYMEDLLMGNVKEPTFPKPSAPMTPGLGSCCLQPGGVCKPDPSLWEAASWQGLRFSMDDPHYYSYEYEQAGSGKNAIFTVRAMGDLDCDGVYSTFEMVGGVENRQVVGGAALFRDKELE